MAPYLERMKGAPRNALYKEQWTELLQLHKKDHNFSFILEPRGALGSLQNRTQEQPTAKLPTTRFNALTLIAQLLVIIN